MVLLRQMFDPSVGIPQPVMLQPKRRMNNPQFYQQQVQQAPQPQFVLGESSRATPSPVQPQQQQQQLTSEDYIKEQFQRLNQRPAVPQLEPAARIQSPNAELVQPSNFQSYYNRLAAIKDTNEALLGAAQARAAYQRMQAMQSSNNGDFFGGAGYGSTVGRYGSGFGAAGSASHTGFGAAGSASLKNVPGVPSNPRENFKYAQSIAGNYGWSSPSELAAWYQLGMKESGWRNTAQNPTSTAYGIGQFLDSTWRGYGIPKTSDPAMQVEAMARYIKARYGSPSRALAFHNSHNWY